MADVYFDQKFVGSVKDPKNFIENIKVERRMGKIPYSVNVHYDKRTEIVIIETCSGRFIRPLVIVKGGKPLLTEKILTQLQNGELSWSDIVKQGIIEYLDATEEEDALVAYSHDDLTTEHTHLEVAPIGIIGYCSSLVPFGHHNHGVRFTQGSKNQKQGLGFYAANYFNRIDMDISLLNYPQQPLVRTVMHEISQIKDHPSGQNVVMAIMSFDGYNMEDAIVVNKGSIERGLGRSTYFRPVIGEELRYSGGLIDEIGVPDKEVKGYRSERDYGFLGDDGIVDMESKVSEGDVIIGKTSPPRFLASLDEYNLSTDSRRESSLSLKHGEHGIVDFVCLTENGQGNKLVQVRIRSPKIPEIGDKFTSRHGQKGVIGMVVPEMNVPFTTTGVRPDIITGPHGVPSRMTVSHLLELASGKTGALSGRFIDATIFESEKESDIRSELKNLGFRENGTETMYDPISGREYLAKIFIGNIYYMKLKHMVSNKLHSRARGPVQLLTRQPTEGRAKEGGLRLGEMEKDTFVAHGASLLLKERFDSDRTIIPICEESGLVAIHDVNKERYYSPVAPDSEVSNIEMGYAFKLMLDELKSLGLYPRLILEDKY